jgi:alpha-L-arabinofuranosidase
MIKKSNLLAIVLLLSFVHTELSLGKNSSALKIVVDCTKTLRKLNGNPTGFCMSFINDADRKGRKPFATVLKSMNVGSLRYPMGTLAENYLFHDLRKYAPVEGSLNPRVITMKKPPAGWKASVNADGSYKSCILDFDEYIAMCRESGAEPVVLVSSHGHLYPEAQFSEEDIIRNAVQWVRYANVTRELGIKYWEIGNEVDLKKVKKIISQSDYLKLYRRMAAEMKAVDPSIRTGLGTMHGRDYAAQALKEFPELVDFIVIHLYMSWIKHFTQYQGINYPVLGGVTEMLKDIDRLAPSERRKTTEILITEYSSFSAGSKQVSEYRKQNSIFNAMVTFEMLATGISMDERIRFMHFWVTHNPWGCRTSTNYANAFGPDNSILPQGRATEMMGRYLRDRFVKVGSSSALVRGWASTSVDSSKMSIWLINKAKDTTNVKIEMAGYTGGAKFSSWQLAGKYPHDTNPSWDAGYSTILKEGSFSYILPPLSITVFYTP